jgi:hypothetical protein
MMRSLCCDFSLLSLSSLSVRYSTSLPLHWSLCFDPLVQAHFILTPTFLSASDTHSLAPAALARYCEGLTDHTMSVIARSAPMLSVLELDGVRLITLTSLRALVDHDVSRRLTTLSLDGEGLDDLAMVTIGAYAKALTVLRVSFCESLTDEALLAISSLVSLTELRLRKGAALTDTGFMTLFSSPSRYVCNFMAMDWVNPIRPCLSSSQVFFSATNSEIHWDCAVLCHILGNVRLVAINVTSLSWSSLCCLPCLAFARSLLR